MSRADHATVPVTVLLPVYNGGAHLVDAIGSILSQTHRALELLVVDDGSTDGTSEMLASLRDPRVRVVTQPNRGLVAALNTGISQARYDLVARMDADDVSDRQRLELQVAYLAEHADVAAVGCCYDVVDDDGRVLTQVHTAADPAYLRRQLYFRNVLPHAGMMVRRAAVLSVGGYRQVGAVEDFDLWARLSAVYELASIPQVLLQYRRSATGVSALAGAVQQDQHRVVRDERLASQPFPPTTASQVVRQGLAHARRYGGTCPDCLRTYTFDHVWLSLLLLQRGNLRRGIPIAAGALALATVRPQAAAGLCDVASGLVLRRRRRRTGPAIPSS